MATSVDKILNYNKDQDDYYAALGCDESSTVGTFVCYFTTRCDIRNGRNLGVLMMGNKGSKKMIAC